MTISDPKHAIRAAAKARRGALSPDGRAAAAEAVAKRLDDVLTRWLPANQAKPIIAGYASIRDELDCRPALERLHARGAALALPVVAGKDSPLIFRAWIPSDSLSPGAFRIPEPAPDAPELRPDILLVPLLAFDRFGHRIGYGAGHYDRTLALLRGTGRIVAIGLAFAVQEIDRAPITRDDQPLDAIVTEADIVIPESPL